MEPLPHLPVESLIVSLTADRVGTYFDGIVLGEVQRYELPQLHPGA
jgi:hypothetical protein